MKQKLAYLWVVTWPHMKELQVTADLFFSSREKFLELVSMNEEAAKREQLIPVIVPASFDKWDFIPDNY